MSKEVNSNQQIVSRVSHFSDLKAWQLGHLVVLGVYKITQGFPKTEQFGLVSQMRRSAVSITSNLAEGFGRTSFKEKLHFYSYAHGSTTELENQLIISRDVQLISEEQYRIFQGQLTELGKITTGLMKSTQQRINQVKPIY